MSNEIQHIGNLYSDVAGRYALAAQPRMKRQPVGHVQPVLFVFLHFSQILFALLDDHVAGRASTVAAARMLKHQSEIQRDVQQRALFAMLVIRSNARLVLDSHRLGVRAKKGDLASLRLRFGCRQAG